MAHDHGDRLLTDQPAWVSWTQLGMVAAMIAWAAWRHAVLPALKDWIRKVAAEGKDGGESSRPG